LIAIVDDDPLVRDSIDSLVRSEGLATAMFAGGSDLLDYDKAADVGCIVTDLNMPGMTGLELQEKIVKIGWRVPIIFMTAFPTPVAQAQAMAAGAMRFLTKPVDPDELLDAIGQAIAQ
jgi:FixJ family two-component response regulator